MIISRVEDRVHLAFGNHDSSGKVVGKVSQLVSGVRQEILDQLSVVAR